MPETEEQLPDFGDTVVMKAWPDGPRGRVGKHSMSLKTEIECRRVCWDKNGSKASDPIPVRDLILVERPGR